MASVKGRPHGDGPTSSVRASVREWLWRPTRAAADQAAEHWYFRLGRSTGYRDGYQAGRDQVLAELVAEQADARRSMAGLAREPTFLALESRRREPGGQAWADNVTAHGGEEYPGGPVPVW